MIDTRKLFNRMGYAGQLGKLGDILCGLWGGLDGKVNAEEGKALSSNDFTDDDKRKMDALMGRESRFVKAVVRTTQEEYSAMEEHDGSTLYIIDGTPPELLVGEKQAALYSVGVYDRERLVSWEDTWELRGDESEEEMEEYNRHRLTGEHGRHFHPLQSDGGAFLKITNSTSDHFVIVFEPAFRMRSPEAHKVEFTLDAPLLAADTLIIDGQTRYASVIGEDGSETDISGSIDWQNWLTFQGDTFLVCDEGNGDMTAAIKCMGPYNGGLIDWKGIFLE